MTPDLEHELIWRIRHEARRMVRADKQAELKATMCQGKHRFPNSAAARGSIRSRLHGEVEPYRCWVCNCWHIGSIRRERRLAVQRLRADGGR